MILSGCRSQGAPAPGLEQDSAGSTAAAQIPTSFSELAPGDTASVVLIMRRTMADIDGATADFTKRDTTLDPEQSQEPRRLTLWLEDNVPRKLLVTEPEESGRMMRESVFYFVQGELRVVLQPNDGYAFDADRILVWTDESLVPLADVTPELRMQRERDVLDQAHRWLGVFGVQLP
ncbi:MAG: hypothetical protein ABIZ70_02200 [Gemmatimonadales bacterium]